MIIIFTLIPIILDFILNLFMPFLLDSLSIFNTSFCIITIFLIYPLFKDNKNYLIYAFIFGTIYDLLFTGLFMFDGIMFLILALVTIYINSNFENNSLMNILYMMIILFIYFGLYSLMIFIFNVAPVDFNKFIYLFSHNIISNIIYGTIIYLIVNKLKERKNNKIKLSYN